LDYFLILPAHHLLFDSCSIVLSESSSSPSLPHTTFPISTPCVYCVRAAHYTQSSQIGTGDPLCCSISLQAANLSPPIRTNTLDSGPKAITGQGSKVPLSSMKFNINLQYF
jgi:hypothetical protein